MSAALIILVNRWLFGYGPTPGVIGFVFAILTAVAGFRLRNQIDSMPKRSAWVWIAAVALFFGILWLYSFDYSGHAQFP
jgi:phosphoglycerol transferase MdoB-like AlkP superfamily enzyme